MQAIQLFGVKAKWFLMLECVLVCLVMTPLVNITYNGMDLSPLGEYIIWSEYGFSCNSLISICSRHLFCFRQFPRFSPLPAPVYILTALVALSIWEIAYPKRHRRVWIVFISTVISALIALCRVGGSCYGYSKMKMVTCNIVFGGPVTRAFVSKKLFFVPALHAKR